MEKQTAGRDTLNDFAPKFAELNDDVLFGEVWSREAYLSLKIRSIVTITSLISKGIVDNSLSYHLSAARKNGVTKTEMAEILTQMTAKNRTTVQQNTVDFLELVSRIQALQSILPETVI